MSPRLSNIVLLLRILFKGLFSGKADEIPEKIKRIIVIPTGKLGDIVCTTPVLVAVRKHFPEATLIVGGNSRLNKQILENSGLVDEYLDIHDFAKVRADVALMTGPSFELAAPLYLAGVPFISSPEVIGGFSPQVTHPYTMLLPFLVRYPYTIGEYAPRERLRSLEPLGIIEEDTTKKLGFSSGAREKVQEVLKDGFKVGITPTAGHKIKEWSEARFAAVTDYLIERYKARVIIIGGPNDKEKVRRTMSSIEHQALVVESTNLNIDELKALIAGLGLFISVDTGPIYIAEAFGIPTIDITGPIDEKEQPPKGPLHINVTPRDRSAPELYVLNAKIYDKTEATRQAMSITVDMVCEAVDELITRIKNHGSSSK